MSLPVVDTASCPGEHSQMTSSRLIAALCAASLACAHPASAPSSASPATASGAVGRPAVGRGAPFSYQATGPTRYLLERHDSVLVRLPNGQSQTRTLGRVAHFTVTALAGSPLRVTITLDSMAVDGPVATAGALDSARGTRWTGTLTAAGRLGGLATDRVSAVGEQFRSMLPTIFPVLPAAGARAGAEWVDTSETALRAEAFDVKEHAVTASRALGQVPHAGVQALQIESSATFTRAGGGSQFGQAVEVQATGTRQVTTWLATTGVLAGSQGSEVSDMTVTIPAMGQSLPVRQTATFSVRLLPAGR